jgi:septum formation protein
MTPEIVLASASPRRSRILGDLGVRFRVVISGLDETQQPGEDAEARVRRLAEAKAAAVARAEGGNDLTIIAADTEVVCEGRILGKPAGPDDALAMLALLSGRTHDVLTGVCVLHGGVAHTDVDRTSVSFCETSPAEREWYVATGEPLDKAGAYHVDGRGGLFIEAIAGSPSNVAGLPVRLVRRLLRECGIREVFP